jgi:hypothetical protein
MTTGAWVLFPSIDRAYWLPKLLLFWPAFAGSSVKHFPTHRGKA